MGISFFKVPNHRVFHYEPRYWDERKERREMVKNETLREKALREGKEWKDEVYGDLEKYNLDLDIDYRILTKDIVDRVHAMGHTVNVWTVNDEESGLRMVEMGVDYITTNILE